MDNEQITIDDKKMLKKPLINGAEMFHKNIDAEGLALEQSLIKPGVKKRKNILFEGLVVKFYG